MVDVYDDLEHFDFSEEVHKLREETLTLNDRIRILENNNKCLSDKYTLLEKEAKELRTNISSLHKTSTTELQRKERTIQELRTQVESLLFKRDRSVNSCNTNREKYPPLTNHGESHSTDSISSSINNRPRDIHTSQQTFHIRNFNELELISMPDKAQSATHNCYEKSLNYNINCAEGQSPVISNSNWPHIRGVELKNSTAFEQNKMKDTNEVKENQSDFLQSVIKTEIEETQYAYMRDKIEERRIELTKLEFERDYWEAESMLKPKNVDNKTFNTTPSRHCLSPRNTKLSVDRGDSLKHVFNKARSRSRSSERFQKFNRKRSRSPYQKTDSKRFRRDRSNSRDTKKNHYRDSKYRTEKYHYERHDKKYENKRSSQRLESSERNDKYIKTSAEYHKYKTTGYTRITTNKNELKKNIFNPVHTKNISTTSFKNSSSHIDVKIQSKDKEDQHNKIRISSEISVGNCESWNKSPVLIRNNFRTEPETNTSSKLVTSQNKDVQCEDFREEIEEGEISTDEYDMNNLEDDSDIMKKLKGINYSPKCVKSSSPVAILTHLNTLSHKRECTTNESKSHHLEESSNCVKKPKVIDSNLTESTDNLNLPVGNSIQMGQNNSINQFSHQIAYNTSERISDHFEECSDTVKKSKAIINSSLKYDNPSSIKPTDNLSLPVENSSQPDQLDLNSQTAYNSLPVVNSPQVHQIDLTSQTACNIKAKKSDHSEECFDSAKEHKVIHSSLKCKNTGLTESTGDLGLAIENSTRPDKTNSNCQTACNTKENEKERTDSMKKCKDMNSLKYDNPSSTKSTDNLSLPVENSSQPDQQKCDNPSSIKSTGNICLPVGKSAQVDEIETAYKITENKEDLFEECSDSLKKPKVIKTSSKCDNPGSTKSTGNLNIPVEKLSQPDQINLNCQKACNTKENKSDLFEECSDSVKKPKDINSSLKCDNSSSTNSTDSLSLPVGNSSHLDQIDLNCQTAITYTANETKSDLFEECSVSVKKPKVIKSPLKCDNSSSNKSAGNFSLPVGILSQPDESNLNCQTVHNSKENTSNLFEECSVKKPKVIETSSKCDYSSSTKSTGNLSQPDQINLICETACNTKENKSDIFEECSDSVKKHKVIETSSKCDSPSSTKSIDNLSLPVGKLSQSDESNSNFQTVRDSKENTSNLFEECSDSVKKPKDMNSSLECDNSSSTKSTNSLSLPVGNSSHLDQINFNCQTVYNSKENISNLFEECSMKKPIVIETSSKCDYPSSTKSTSNLNLSLENSSHGDQINLNCQTAHNTKENKSDLFEECSDSVKKPKVIETSSKCDSPSSTKSIDNLSLPVRKLSQPDQINMICQTVRNSKENTSNLFEECPVKKPKVIETSSKCDYPSSSKLTGNLNLPVGKLSQPEQINLDCQTAITCTVNENKSDLLEECSVSVKKPKVIETSSKCDYSSSTKSTGNLSQPDQINLICETACNTKENKSDIFEECSDSVKKHKVIETSSKCDSPSSTKSIDNLSLPVGKLSQSDESNSNFQTVRDSKENTSNLFEECSDSVKKPKDMNSSLECDNSSSTKSTNSLSLPVGNSSHLDQINFNCQTVYNSKENISNLFEECSMKKPIVIETSSKCDYPSSTKSTSNLNLSLENSSHGDQINLNCQTAHNTKENKSDLFEECSDSVKKPKVIETSSKCDSPSSTKSIDNLSLPVRKLSQPDQINMICQTVRNSKENTSNLFEECPVKKPKVIETSSKCDYPSSSKLTGNLNLPVGKLSQPEQINLDCQTAITCTVNENKSDLLEECSVSVKKPKVIKSPSKCDNPSSIKSTGNFSLPVGKLSQPDESNSNCQTARNTKENKSDLFEECSDSVKKPKVIKTSSRCDNLSSTKSTDSLNLPVGNSSQPDQINVKCQTARNTKENKSDHFEESSDSVKKPKAIKTSSRCDNPSSTNSLSLPAGNSSQPNQINVKCQTARNTKENKSDILVECSVSVKKPKVIKTSSKCDSPSSTKSVDNLSLPVGKLSQPDQINMNCQTVRNSKENTSNLFEECPVKKPKVIKTSSKCDYPSSSKLTGNLNLPVGKLSKPNESNSDCQTEHNSKESTSVLFEKCSNSVKKPKIIKTSTKCDNPSSTNSIDNLCLPVGKLSQPDKINLNCQTACNKKENISNPFEDCFESVKKPKVIKTSSKCDNPSSTKSTGNLILPVVKLSQPNESNSNFQTVRDSKENTSNLFEECSDSVKRSEDIKTLKGDDPSSTNTSGNLSSTGNPRRLEQINSNHQKIITKHPRKIQYCFSDPSRTISSEKAKIIEKSGQQVSDMHNKINASSVTDNKECNTVPKDIRKCTPQASVSVPDNIVNSFHVKIRRKTTIIKRS